MTDVEAFLEHHGIKGMRWGVRNKKETSDHKSFKLSSGQKKVAVAVGSAAGLAALTAGALYLKKHYDIPVTDLVKPKIQEPTDIIHVARGKHAGYRFLKTGNVTAPLDEFKKGFGTEEPNSGTWKRYGDRLEKVAVSFNDPEGRKDFAGRPIKHDVILPEHHARNVGTYTQAVRKAWTLIKPHYDPFWEKSLTKQY